MRANSLALRLFLSATAWAVVTLAITGVVLSSLYREAVERSFDRRLDVYLRALVADLTAPDDSQKFPQSLGEPLFELPLSGWYWQVTRLDTATPDVRSSRSLWDGNLPRLREPAAAGNALAAYEGYINGPDDQRLRTIERNIDLGDEGRFLVVVAGDASEISDETRGFDQALLITFTVLAIVLLLTTMFQVRFGLAPLKRISASLASIRSGASERLEGKFPDEIAPLARETNALLDANREIVERARTHVGNLAHALKTPISVMINEAEGRRDDPLAAKVLEQADIMRDQVTRHLERARLAARLTVVESLTDMRPVIDALSRTMEKIYRERDISISVEAPAQVQFRGERTDLEEMIGNLVDNACKWASSRVAIEVVVPAAEAERRMATITVDDDGPGLTPAQREQVAKRGRRLDETKPGSGLGLSIVVELAGLYGGNLTLAAAPIGGLRAVLTLPAA